MNIGMYVCVLHISVYSRIWELEDRYGPLILLSLLGFVFRIVDYDSCSCCCHFVLHNSFTFVYLLC